MNEAIAGVPPAVPARVRDASAVVLYRRDPELQVFWIKRESTLAFAGGFYAFPGGRVDATDASVPVSGATEKEAALVAAAARELFEETGVLVGDGADHVPPSALASFRRALLDEKRSFPEFLREQGLRVRARDFLSAGRWITPPWLPIRYDARFFLVELPFGSTAEVWRGELTGGAWIAPREALKGWEEGTALLHPPALHAFRVMADFRSPEDAAAKLRDQPYAPGHIATRIEFQRGVRLFALETPTLPPATHTNSYILGNGELLIVDPGASAVRQYARLLALIASLKAEGKRPLAVFLTHHHADHVGGARAVKERLGIPVWCHERTAERLPFAADRLLKDGEEISVAGLPAMKFRVLHTPGHARGHLCLMDEASKSLIAGDMVAGIGTVLVDPPDGEMGDYLQQLERLRALGATVLYPAHGPVILDGPSKLTEYIRHREMRERKVLEAISPGGASMQEIVPRAYDDVGPEVHPIAERSTLAILIKLVREGKIVRKGERYYPS